METDLAGGHRGGFAEVGPGGVDYADVVLFVSCEGGGVREEFF